MNWQQEMKNGKIVHLIILILRHRLKPFSPLSTFLTNQMVPVSSLQTSLDNWIEWANPCQVVQCREKVYSLGASQVPAPPVENVLRLQYPSPGTSRGSRSSSKNYNNRTYFQHYCSLNWVLKWMQSRISWLLKLERGYSKADDFVRTLKERTCAETLYSDLEENFSVS